MILAIDLYVFFLDQFIFQVAVVLSMVESWWMVEA